MRGNTRCVLGVVASVVAANIVADLLYIVGNGISNFVRLSTGITAKDSLVMALGIVRTQVNQSLSQPVPQISQGGELEKSIYGV